MSAEELAKIKLECLKVAATKLTQPEDILKFSQEYFDWVIQVSK